MGRITEIDMRRRRLRRLKKMNNSSITYTKDEPYAICFYLYNLFEEKSNSNVINDNDEAIKVFLLLHFLSDILLQIFLFFQQMV